MVNKKVQKKNYVQKSKKITRVAMQHITIVLKQRRRQIALPITVTELEIFRDGISRFDHALFSMLVDPMKKNTVESRFLEPPRETGEN